jgi:hypothetical protein
LKSRKFAAGAGINGRDGDVMMPESHASPVARPAARRVAAKKATAYIEMSDDE